MSKIPQPTRRTIRLAVVLAVTSAVALLCCTGASGMLLVDSTDDREGVVNAAFSCGQTGPLDPNGPLPRIDTLSDEQVRNAAIIIQVGSVMAVPPRGWVIAVATALQESYLRNLGHLGPRNDHDSLGLFQQRPSQGWGTPEQIMDPEYASRRFYEKLRQVPGWQQLPLTEAAQAVQRSAYPDAYAKHEPFAALIVDLLTGGAARAASGETALRCTAPGEISASGWTAPVIAPIVSGFRTPHRPTHHGVDLAAPRGTPIRVAASGVVIVARCDAASTSGAAHSCDQDGSLAVRGCGWYVDVLHAENIITRYCHMLARPRVSVGDRVTVGDVLGEVGSSGNSSGPHLHFETHLDGDRSSAGAVNPEQFMRERGVLLGELG